MRIILDKFDIIKLISPFLNLENRHMLEKDRWQEQRIYLNTALKISTFLRDCYEIKKQLEVI